MLKSIGFMQRIILIAAVFYGSIFAYLAFKPEAEIAETEPPASIFIETADTLQCNTYGITNCPADCGVCPPGELSSSLVCEALNTCLFRGFDHDWQAKARGQVTVESTTGSEYATAYWSEVPGYLGAGMVKQVTERPNLDVVIYMTDGTKKIAKEPAKDAIYAAVEECGAPCAAITEVVE